MYYKAMLAIGKAESGVVYMRGAHHYPTLVNHLWSSVSMSHDMV